LLFLEKKGCEKVWKKHGKRLQSELEKGRLFLTGKANPIPLNSTQGSPLDYSITGGLFSCLLFFQEKSGFPT